jgi:beta-phosphoglucomutase-like phosphatase (HAD superfamily)
MQNPEKFLTDKQASQVITKLGIEFAVVKNPDYIHPEFELYPLAPKIFHPVKKLATAVMDMDGTTTTTESLCIHSLGYMIRKITDRMSKQSWQGLDPIKDYSHIIGNSTTKHVEYLIQTYQSHINIEAMKKAYFHAALWFLLFGKDKRRIEEARNNLVNLGFQDILKDEQLNKLIHTPNIEPEQFSKFSQEFLERHDSNFRVNSFSDIVRAGIDIYYQRYHEILSMIQAGKGETLSAQILGKPNEHLIEPMPGVGEFLALIKGWLGEDIKHRLPQLVEAYQKTNIDTDSSLLIEKLAKNIIKLGKRFETNPLKVAVVTSSIFYEAEIVMTEVFRVLFKQIENWQIPPARKEMIQEKFSDYKNVYDGFVTASDSSEIRLKPHRDLYSIALHQLGIPKEKFNEVVGFEDSESGTIAIRAAGIGLCVAVPFSDTQLHDLRAAAYVLKGGLPETLLKYNLFLKM